jgi:hypothetical protein
MLSAWFSGYALRRWASRDLDEEMIMETYRQRLVLGCVVLAIEVIRLANNLVALLNVTCNYRHDSEVVISI